MSRTGANGGRRRRVGVALAFLVVDPRDAIVLRAADHLERRRRAEELLIRVAYLRRRSRDGARQRRADGENDERKKDAARDLRMMMGLLSRLQRLPDDA